MNIEEARKHIGKEVILDESTKPYALNSGEKLTESAVIEINKAFKLKLFKIDNDGDAQIDVMNENGGKDDYWNISPHHLKIKEKPMKNYKIRVTPETSAEVQELFFELGCKWYSGIRQIKYQDNPFLFVNHRYQIEYGDDLDFFEQEGSQEITLPQLRDLVVLKRNDVGDATHTDNITHNYKYYVGANVYTWEESGWHKSDLTIETIENGGISLRLDAQITWQDALRAVADGKEVEFKNLQKNNWDNIGELCVFDIVGADCKFRLKPQTTHIEGGDYTKEELLKIAGEME